MVDAKEVFEYTPGILRAYVKPAHFGALAFTLQNVLEHRMGVKFIWGEVNPVEILVELVSNLRFQGREVVRPLLKHFKVRMRFRMKRDLGLAMKVFREDQGKGIG